MEQVHSWWQRGVIYQVYPRSFADSNGDGVGDLRGITSRLDYLQWLGVDALWLSPIYPSPMADFGYDVSDYVAIHPLFGDLHDFDTLLHEAHARQLKLILDFVPNHTSDEHAWFQASRASRDNEKRDWYIWRDPAPDGGAPNNWVSLFGGSAWQFDAQTDQYYLHLFDVKQPDLNWRNPQVREAMLDTLRFWLERGVDGFRVDVLWLLLKDEQFRDNPMNPLWKPGDPPYMRQEMLYTEDQPGIHELMRAMRSVIESYGERVFIGEIYLPTTRLVGYYGETLDEVHLPFNFQLVTAPTWEAQLVRQMVDEYDAALPQGAWPNWVLGNHDRARIASRIGREQARVAQMLLLTVRGTPTCYYGDELGMVDVAVPHALMHDPQGKDNPAHSRDPQRTPMQWDSSPNAGFSAANVTPWLPLAADAQQYNVEVERQTPGSTLQLIQRLLELRRSLSALEVGSYQALDHENAACFVYRREDQSASILIALNFSAEEQEVRLPTLEGQAQLLCSTIPDGPEQIHLAAFHLRPNEGIVLQIQGQ